MRISSKPFSKMLLAFASATNMVHGFKKLETGNILLAPGLYAGAGSGDGPQPDFASTRTTSS
jgi:hypothetical protein